MIRRFFALIALVLCASCANDVAPGTVEMVAGRRFDPQTITIKAGETVTWVNTTDEAHTVTASQNGIPEGAEYFASGGFDSEEEATEEVADGLMEEGETFEVTFDEPGTYHYYCIPHEPDGMTGTVVVE